jgi:peptide-methionine (R)-S-oxide reductase
MKYPLEKSATQWKEELGEEKYRVLREKNGASTQNFTL